MSTSVKPDAEELTEATDATFDHPVVPQTSPFTYRYGEDDTKSNFPVVHDLSRPKKSRSSVCSVSISVCRPISTTFDTEYLLTETDPKRQNYKANLKQNDRIIVPLCIDNMFKCQNNFSLFLCFLVIIQRKMKNTFILPQAERRTQLESDKLPRIPSSLFITETTYGNISEV